MCQIIDLPLNYKSDLLLRFDFSKQQSLSKLAPDISLLGLPSKEVLKRLEELCLPFQSLPIKLHFSLLKTDNSFQVSIVSVTLKFCSFFNFLSLLNLYKIFLFNVRYSSLKFNDMRTTLLSFTSPRIRLFF